MAVLPALLKQAIKAPARPAADPKAMRRATFIKAVKEQLQLVNDPATTRTVKVKGVERQIKIKPWFYTTTEGDTILAPKFGVRALELGPGLTALKVTTKADLKRVLEQLETATQSGELDSQLAAATPAPKPKKPAKAQP